MAKMGRPPKAKQHKQSERIICSLTPGQAKELKRLARAEGVAPGAYLVNIWQNTKKK